MSYLDLNILLIIQFATADHSNIWSPLSSLQALTHLDFDCEAENNAAVVTSDSTSETSHQMGFIFCFRPLHFL